MVVESVGGKVKRPSVPHPTREPREHIPNILVSRRERSGYQESPQTPRTETGEPFLGRLEHQDGPAKDKVGEQCDGLESADLVQWVRR